jgi:hypothetical protein
MSEIKKESLEDLALLPDEVLSTRIAEIIRADAKTMEVLLNQGRTAEDFTDKINNFVGNLMGKNSLRRAYIHLHEQCGLEATATFEELDRVAGFYKEPNGRYMDANSPLLYSKTPTQFYEDVDNALIAVGLSPEEVNTMSDQDLLKTNKPELVRAFRLLILQGYNYADLAQ